MKKICVIFRRGPHEGGREGVDFALLSASFDQQVSVVFCDEGVLHLLPDQQPQLIGQRDYLATLKALPLYDVETVLACKLSLSDYGMSRTDLAIACQQASAEEISQLLADSDEVVVF
ncbi:MAG: sulfurtransferase complex subunit TusC [Shewanella sp.]